MTVLLDDLEFNVVLQESTMRPLLEIIIEGNSIFVDLEKLQRAIKFLEEEANR